MKRILFIVNPVSGGKKKDFLEQYIPQFCALCKKEVFPEIIFTNHIGHAKKIAGDNSKNFDTIVAVGGDGTVNEIASALVHSNANLGIVPSGSGNGLARHLSIPVDLDKALQKIIDGKVMKIDCGSMDNTLFFCTCGVGFDARIGHVFKNSLKRGFVSYVASTIKEFLTYKPGEYSIELNGHTYQRKAFLVTVANASQYGNNAYIAPHASLCDGLLDVVVLKPFHWLQSIGIVYRLFTKSIQQSKRVENYKSTQVVIRNIKSKEAHCDGEPVDCGEELKINIIPNALNIIV